MPEQEENNDHDSNPHPMFSWNNVLGNMFIAFADMGRLAPDPDDLARCMSAVSGYQFYQGNRGAGNRGAGNRGASPTVNNGTNNQPLTLQCDSSDDDIGRKAWLSSRMGQNHVSKGSTNRSQIPSPVDPCARPPESTPTSPPTNPPRITPMTSNLPTSPSTNTTPKHPTNSPNILHDQNQSAFF